MKPGRTATSAEPPTEAAKLDAVRRAIAEMPDECFSWLPNRLGFVPTAHGPVRSQIFPDGLGGFSQKSREAIERFNAALNALLP